MCDSSMDPIAAEQSVQAADNEHGQDQVAGLLEPNMCDHEDADNEPQQDQIAGSLEQNIYDPNDVDSAARKREAIAKCLGTDEIVHKIFQCLSNSDLTVAGNVNRLWKYEAGRLLKCRHVWFYGFSLLQAQATDPQTLLEECTQISMLIWLYLRQLEHRDVVIDQPSIVAALKDINAREHINDFLDSLVRVSSAGPSLCGIFVKLGGQHGYSCQEPPAYELSKFRTKHHNDQQTTSLAAHFGPLWDQHQDCAGFKLLKKLLDADRWHIYWLSLHVSSKRHLFLKKALHLQDYKFKYLLSLSFQDVGSYTTSPNYTKFVKELVHSAPNLKVVRTLGRVDLSGILPEGSQVVHLARHPYSPSLDEIPANAVSSLKMKKIELIGICEDFSLQRFNRITRGLLRISRYTLTQMDIDLPFLLALTDFGITLDLVQNLHIILDSCCFYEFENQDGWNLMKSFDFNRLLPNLEEVEIAADWESHLRQKNVLKALTPVVGLVNRNLPADRAVSVSVVRAVWDADLGERSLQALGQTFPNNRTLSIEAKRSVAFDAIWSSWLDLVIIDIRLLGAEEDPSLNLDSIFCGIFSDKVAELREKDDKYLQAVNIVPVMASVTNLKSLTHLSLFLDANSQGGPCADYRPDFLFSKVTPLVAFRKLHVTLGTNDEDIEKALKHLKPYVSTYYGEYVNQEQRPASPER